MRRSTSPSLLAPRQRAWSSSRDTARSAGCAPRSTTPCPSRVSSAWSSTCASSSAATVEHAPARGNDKNEETKGNDMTRAFRVLVLNQISPFGLERLPSDTYQVGKDVEAPDAVLVRSADMHSMAIPDSVIAIGRAGA